jgi:hypothetical protein
VFRDNVDVVGAEALRKYRLIGEFARNVSDMLEHLVDKLEPRDFEQLRADGFRDIVAQIEGSDSV